MFAEYKKAFIAAGVVLAAFLVALTDPANGISIDDGVTTLEALTLLGLLAGVGVVTITPDLPGHESLKAAAYLVLAVFAVVPTAAWLDGITYTEIITGVLAVLGYFGIRSKVPALANRGDYKDRAVPPLTTTPPRV